LLAPNVWVAVVVQRLAMAAAHRRLSPSIDR
jgi:hypothetical protein